MNPLPLFSPAPILLPGPEVDLARWSVLACDQFTSRPDYWQQARALVGSAPSSLDLILPEAYLDEPDLPQRVARAHRAMEQALAQVLTRRLDGFVYLVRQTPAGPRRGLVGMVDLEQYSYQPGSLPLIRPTEHTVESRIPPRLALRRGAALESPHILMLADDPQDTLLGPIEAACAGADPLYDFELMLGGGRVTGWAVTRPALVAGAAAAAAALGRRPGPGPSSPIALAVGDGNHSLATAKAFWEECKATLPPDKARTHPARFCLVEVENLHDPALCIEPIHRAVFGLSAEELLCRMRQFFAAAGCPLQPAAAGGPPPAAEGPSAPQQFTLLCGSKAAAYTLPRPAWPLCVGSIEAFLAQLAAGCPGVRVDYIHGREELARLAAAGAVGLLLPPLQKQTLLRGVYAGGVLPKKAFSMGRAQDKRYYLECRSLRP